MTIDEAISVVKDIKAEMEDARDSIAVEALGMAIEVMQEKIQLVCEIKVAKEDIPQLVESIKRIQRMKEGEAE
ncbi:MAG: hypothetical protein IIY21_09740 [Clostridiales bacterium]|nr:hypothetical protein [Clostridiales bacterium]